MPNMSQTGFGLGLPLLSGRRSGNPKAGSLANAAIVADFNAWRFAVTTVPLDDIATASPEHLRRKRAASFDELFAFEAASTETRFYLDQNGHWRNDLSAHQPRQDWRDGRRRLRLEAGKTNLLTHSADPSNPVWNATQLSLVAGVGDPAGGNTAFRLIPTAADTPHALSRMSAHRASATNGTTYTHSAIVKPDGYGALIFECDVTNGGTYRQCGLDIATGTIAGDSSGGAIAMSSHPLPNGFYQISATFTADTSKTIDGGWFIVPHAASAKNFIGDETSGLIFWNQQLEAGHYPSDPIITDDTAASRATETARFSPLVEAIMQPSAASILVRGRITQALNADHRDAVIVGGGQADMQMLGAHYADSAPHHQMRGHNGDDFQFPINGNWNSSFGAVAAFDETSIRASVNGSPAMGRDEDGGGDRSALYLSRAISSASNYADALYDLVAIYPQRLADSDIAALSTLP